MRYDSDLLYRPPGEWKSYLLQCTIGCSNNKCTFCGMYKEKKFRIRPTEEILEDIDMAREYYGPNLRRVFLMDGDAIIIKTEELLKILHKLYETFPLLEKVTVYAGPKSTLSKTPVRFAKKHACCVIKASAGYPESYKKGYKLTMSGRSAKATFVAGAKLENGELLTSGGRVTGTTAVRSNLKDAIDAAYRLSAGVKFRNAYSRSDIGQKALAAKK